MNVDMDEAILQGITDALAPAAMCDADLVATVEHLYVADQLGIRDQGTVRIPWLLDESMRYQTRRWTDGPVKCVSVPLTSNTWKVSGPGRIGYSLMKAAVNYPFPDGPNEAPQLVIVDGCFPSGALGIWGRHLADKGWASIITATSHRRVPHPGGGAPFIGTTPISVTVPSQDSEHLVADLALTEVTYGDVIAGDAARDQLRFPNMKLWALGIALETMVRSMSYSSSAVLMLLFRPVLDSVWTERRGITRRLPGDRG